MKCGLGCFRWAAKAVKQHGFTNYVVSFTATFDYIYNLNYALISEYPIKKTTVNLHLTFTQHFYTS